MKTMMKPVYLKLIISIMLIALLAGACSKDDDDNGDTPPDEKDGKIAFYTDNMQCGPIDITLNNESTGQLTAAFSGSSAPDCGGPNTLTIDVNIGAHNYHAEDTCNSIWEGTIIINKGDCKVKLLSR